MRVTNKMMADSVLNTVNVNLKQLSKLQQQMASAKIINRPSDNPIGTARLLSAQSELRVQEQHQRNMQDAAGWLETTDGALARLNDVLQRIRELAVNGANASLPKQSMEALADEVNQLAEELVQIGNTSYAGRYIFGGTQTTRMPFAITSTAGEKVTEVSFLNNAADVANLDEIYKFEIDIEPGTKINVSSGLQSFHTNSKGEKEINAVFDTIMLLRKNLEEGNSSEVTVRIEEIDGLIDNVLSERAIVGARSKRVETAQTRITLYNLNLTDLIGRLEDLDYAEATIHFKTQQVVYQAALETGARLIQPNLMDYLK
ncbi:MAG: flagellar hook-associated protein FlgL [Syntrophomonadaceae bacterium]|jgi:flagellar hook-associated protein 3 FlgL